MKIKPIILIINLLFMTLSHPLSAKILTAKSMKNVEHLITELLKSYRPAELFVAFDIDMTLIQPDHPALYYPALKKYVKHYKSILGTVTPENRDWISTWAALQFPQRLVESKTPEVIKNLQSKGIPVIAFTASLSGSLIPDQMKAIHFRRQQLEEKGIKFIFGESHDEISFSEFPPFANSHPMFYKGILSANGEKNTSKGTVFCAFLKSIMSMAKVIILVDDKRKHLEDMGNKLQECMPTAQFIGIQYEGAYDYAPKEISEKDFIQFWKNAIQQLPQHQQS